MRRKQNKFSENLMFQYFNLFRDEYVLNKCTDKAWFVVELWESMKVWICAPFFSMQSLFQIPVFREIVASNQLTSKTYFLF